MDFKTKLPGEFYTGLTGGTFKKRWWKHCDDIRRYNPNDGSYGKRMSRYVGSLAAQNIPYTISWSIVTREFFASCLHKQKLLLKNNLSPG